jgi:hypothetical protein
MLDETEGYRRARQAELNAEPATREELERRYGRVWDSDELRAEFTVLGFAAPFVVVRDQDGRKGTLEFQASPRFYVNFVPDQE